MANILLTIQHGNQVFTPPVEEGVQIEWERTGSPGKLTFTTVKSPSGEMKFTEGDPVCLYYDGKLVFMGYVFTKKNDREQNISVTCYDQIRYLKNKYTYVFENKTANQIVKAMCDDFGLQVGSSDNTAYVIPAIAEENIAAIDIIMDVLEETLLNTGNMFVFYDDAGSLKIKNALNMVSTTMILEDTAENFDYSSSIDSETYNNVVLYYTDDKKGTQLYTAQSPSRIREWGMLRYFEKVDTPSIGQNKANMLLKLYNRKTRELTVKGAFGDITVRGGTMIPVKLNLGDVQVNNFMVVEKVTHKFEADHHTMDLTLEGEWNDSTDDIVSSTLGELASDTTTSSNTTNSNTTDSTTTAGGGFGGGTASISGAGRVDKTVTITIQCNGIDAYAGSFRIWGLQNGVGTTVNGKSDTISLNVDKGKSASIDITRNNSHGFNVSYLTGSLKNARRDYTSVGTSYSFTANEDSTMILKWVK